MSISLGFSLTCGKACFTRDVFFSAALLTSTRGVRRSYFGVVRLRLGWLWLVGLWLVGLVGSVWPVDWRGLIGWSGLAGWLFGLVGWRGLIGWFGLVDWLVREV